MAGYWPSSFAKKERGQYPAIFTEQTWSIKDLLDSFQGNFSCGIQRVVPSILPTWVAKLSQCAIWAILPAGGASHIITEHFVYLHTRYSLMHGPVARKQGSNREHLS